MCDQMNERMNALSSGLQCSDVSINDSSGNSVPGRLSAKSKATMAVFRIEPVPQAALGFTEEGFLGPPGSTLGTLVTSRKVGIATFWAVGQR